MKSLYHLGSCNTCQRIIDDIKPGPDVHMREIKSSPITPEELEALYQRAGSYEALFSRRARLYTTRNLKEQTLTEEDYKTLILGHYTFLKRPVIVSDDEIFIGSSKKVVNAAADALA